MEVWHVGFTEIMLLEKSLYEFAGEKYRVFTSPFIHKDMPTLATSIILLLVWGSNIEYMIGFPRTILLFFLSSYTANLFGLYFSQSLFDSICGADGGAFALLGAGLGYSLLNWRRIHAVFY